MKTAVVLTGLLAALAISAQAGALPISIESLTVTNEADAAGSNVTITAVIRESYLAYGGAQVTLNIKSTNSLVGQQFQPETIAFDTEAIGLAKDPLDSGICTWTNVSWNPYFNGDFVVTLTAALTNNLWSDVSATTVTVVRTFGGTMHSVQVPVDTNAAYDANGAFTNIDLARVYLHNIGVVADAAGAISVGCNLINVTNITQQMTAEQMDIAFTDTAEYRPAGTPFRFDLSMSARPNNVMSFGDVKRFVWTPVSADAPDGPGRLVLDVASCSPWRNNYSTNLQAHVGFAPLFMTDTNIAAEMKGMVMSTTAHYMDVSPQISSIGVGLKVNGRSNTTSYLKAFLPDSLLARWEIPVAWATNVLVGYVTHYNSNDISKGDTTKVTTEFTRIAGGTNIIYAYNSGTNGDSGYEARFTFEFQSPVAAQMGPIVTGVLGDYDGDGKSDLALYRDGYWSIFTMAGNVLLNNAGVWGAPYSITVPGDYDGDGKADLAVYCAGYWSILSLANGVILNNAGVWGGWDWVPVAGDYDGDGKSDLAVYRDGYWSILSLANGVILNNAGVWGGSDALPVSGDYDGDGRFDLAVYRAGYWSIFSIAYGVIFNNAGVWGGWDWVPVPGDYDGDGKDDLALYRNGYWSIYTMAGSVLLNNTGVWGALDAVAVPGDYDGDGKSDLAVYRNGYWSILSLVNGVILNNAGVWGGNGWIPER